MKWGSILLTWILGATAAFAESSPTKKLELFFPVEKNHIQILPQRFEYHLLNKDQIQIGNALFDANQIEFTILPLNAKKDRFKLRFRWPANLLGEGEIAFKDNSGKAIWFQKIKKNLIRISKDQTLATYETETEVPSLLKLVRLYPFFKFCVHREEPLTKIYLCSKDLYLRNQKDKVSILARDSHRPESFVEINGQPVGEQGVIFLNAPSEFISMRALLLSGATVELDTRMKNINFKDVFLSEDKKQIIVKAQGSEPVDRAAVEHLPGDAADEWQTHLDIERPYVYVKGEGDLPLRQEFLISGPVRTDNIKVAISSETIPFTFQDEEVLRLKTSPGIKLADSGDRTKLSQKGPNDYEWTLTRLEKNETNRRYVKVFADNQEYTGAYDLERAAPFDANLRLFAPLWSQANLLYTPRPQWGVTGRLDTQFDKADSNLKVWTVAAQYRFPVGLHMRDQVYWIDASAQSFETDIKKPTFLGLGVGAELKSPSLWSGAFPWTHIQARLPLMSLDSSTTLKTSYELEATLRSPVTPKLYWELGARTHNYEFNTNNTDFKSNKSMGLVGLGYIF